MQDPPGLEIKHVPRARAHDGRGIILVGFFRPVTQPQTGPACASCVTAMAAWWTMREGRSYSHVELRFSDYTVTSVTQNSTVHYEPRVLSNPGYTCFFRIPVSAEQEQRMQQMAREYCERRIPFNKAGFWWNFLPLVGARMPLRREGSAVFCSEYITRLLQAGDLLPDHLDSATISPTDLYMLLHKGEVPEARAHYNEMLAASQPPPVVRLGALSGSCPSSTTHHRLKDV